MRASRAAAAPLTLLLNNDAYPVGDALRRWFALRARAGGERRRRRGYSLRTLLRRRLGSSCCPTPTGTTTAATFRISPTPSGRASALGVSGAGMAVRTQWFLESGGFDESYVNGFDANCACARVRKNAR